MVQLYAFMSFFADAIVFASLISAGALFQSLPALIQEQLAPMWMPVSSPSSVLATHSFLHGCQGC